MVKQTSTIPKSERKPSHDGRLGRTSQEHSSPYGVAQLQRAAGNRAVQDLLIANAGIAGSAGTMPHFAAIQSCFGSYDLSTVKAHVGTEATAASRGLNALAYTTRNHIAFAGTPDLRTAAHEATHVVQQQAFGLNRKSALSPCDDPAEREADAVADLVVQRKPVETLLHQCAERTRNVDNGAIQRQPDKHHPAQGHSSDYMFQWAPPLSPLPTTLTPHAVTTYLVTVTPERAERSMAEVSEDLRSIGSRAGLNAKGEIKFGTFAKVKLKVRIPTEVPSLMLDVDLEGKYANEIEKQELEIKLNVGIDWLSLITVKKSRYLKLNGDDLGEAFVDALKQITRQILIEYGVEQTLLMLALSKKSEYSFLKKLWSQREIQDLYVKYCVFFRDNPKVGFEVGGGLELGVGTDDLKGTFEKIQGIEDVDDKNPTVFTEVALGGHVKIPPSSDLDLRLAWRTRRDGSQVKKFELDGKIPGFAGDPDGVVKRIKNFIKTGALATVLGVAADQQEEGATLDIDTLALALRATIPEPGAKDKLSFSLSFEKTETGPKTEWKAKVRIKALQSLDPKWTGSKVGKALKMASATKEEFSAPKPGTIGVGLDIDFGTFVDISAEIETCLNEEEKKAQATKKPVVESLVRPAAFRGLDTNPAFGAMQRAEMRAKQGLRATKSNAPK